MDNLAIVCQCCLKSFKSEKSLNASVTLELQEIFHDLLREKVFFYFVNKQILDF